MHQPQPAQIKFDENAIVRMLQLSRLSALPDKPPIPASGAKAWDLGIDLSFLKNPRSILENEWTWNQLDEKINQEIYKQFTVPIGEGVDALTLHYLHARSKRDNAVPLLLLHGWPGSIYDFHKVIGDLIDPPEGEKAFHVIVPSLPGYLLSTLPQRDSWTVIDTAHVYNKLMVDILGYKAYAVQGGDWGFLIARILGARHSDSATFIHINLALPPVDFDPTASESSTPLTEGEKIGLQRTKEYAETGRGYFELQRTKPFTIGYAVGASPLSVLAYVGDKFHAWSDLERLEPMDIVNTSVLYYLYGCSASAALIYHESAHLFGDTEVDLSSWSVKSRFGYTHYRYELAVCPRTALDRYCESVTYVAEYDRGGHFPALDVPNLYVEDLRKCFAGF